MEALAILGTFGTIATFIYLFFTTRHKERMSLIESGRDASIFSKEEGGLGALKYGILFLSIGLGVLIGITLSEMFGFDEIIILPSMLICGGLGLLLYYKIVTDRRERAIE